MAVYIYIQNILAMGQLKKYARIYSVDIQLSTHNNLFRI